MQAMKLDRSSPIPLHQQIECLLRRMARRPEYREGKLLPTEVTLAAHLHVSRNTLRAAMTRLEAEGLLQRTPKVGTRVGRSQPHTSLRQWHSFTEEMRRQGITVENYALALRHTRAANDVAAALGVDPTRELWRLQRVRGWDGVPAVLAISWLHPDLKLTGNEDFRAPLYEVIHRASGRTPAVSREQISALKADATVAAALNLAAGAPVLLRRRIIQDGKGRPIEYNLNYYRTDRYTLTLDMESPTGR